MDVLVLAGGEAPDDLAQATHETERALVSVGERAMLLRVLEALRGVAEIERAAVVGSPRVLDVCAQFDAQILGISAGEKMTENFARGTQALQDGRETLVCTCDIPLVSSQTFEAFLQNVRARNLEIAYPIVSRDVCEQQFPEGKRTYAKLGGEEWTGGNCVLFPTRIAPNVIALLETAYNARKNPLALAKMLGPSFLWKFVTKKLTVADVEKQAGRVLECRVGAVECDDATIAFDVDKLEHWKSAENYLHGATL